MAGPKPGGDKQALIDAFRGAQAQHGGGAPAPNAPDADAAAEQAQGVQDGDETQNLSGDPAVKSLELQVQHLEHLLVQRGVISPSDLITPPAPPMAPQGPPPGAPGMPPAGGLPPPAPGGPIPGQ